MAKVGEWPFIILRLEASLWQHVISHGAFDSAEEGNPFASRHRNRSVRSPRCGPFHFICDFRL